MEYQLLTPIIPANVQSPVERVFANRGIYPENIYHYLHTTTEDILPPSQIDNMEAGAKMLMSHFAKGDKIFIQIDSDVDGYTSAAALINYLNMLAPGHAQHNISYRIHDGKQHGIVLDTIPEDVQLVVVPDAGSNDYEQHKALKERGIDVLVIDHHETDEISQDACIINNQTCNYPNKTLSGVGMVYKFCSFLDERLQTKYADDLLDLVAIGMVSDMMDLRDFETKELIERGVNRLRNPFVVAFSTAQNFFLKGVITPFGISFYIAPYINATIRMGTLDEKLLLFESMLDFKAYEQIPSTKKGYKGQYETRIEQACRNCKNIKNRQTRAVDTTLEIIEAIIKRDNLLEHPIIVIKLDNPVEENLTGLIANQIMGKYMRPVLLLNHCVLDDGTVVWRGSGRNATYSKLDNLRKFLADSGLVEYASGHASAFGVSIFEKDLDALMAYIDEQLAGFDFSNCYRVDFIWLSNETDKYKQSIMDIGKLKPIWGQGLSEPQVAIENVNVRSNNLTLMSPDKKPTLRITLPGGLTLVKFRSSQEEYDSLYSDTGCITLNIVGTCNLNEWNGNFSPQIIIEDYEIISKSAYYF